MEAIREAVVITDYAARVQSRYEISFFQPGWSGKIQDWWQPYFQQELT